MSDHDFFETKPHGADPGASDESPQSQMRHVLQSLNASKLISDQCLHCGLQLVEDTSKNQEHSDNLNKFINHLHKSLTQKPESSEETRGVSSLIPSLPSLPSVSWPWSKAKVFICVSGETFGAHKPIKDKLKSKVDMISNPQDCDVIVLFCPVSSRVGSDVEAALKMIPESMSVKPVILVLMHHTRNIYYSADESDWSNEHSAVASHVHVLFHETQKGLLKCQKNNQAVQSLLDQCIKHAK